MYVYTRRKQQIKTQLLYRTKKNLQKTCFVYTEPGEQNYYRITRRVYVIQSPTNNNFISGLKPDDDVYYCLYIITYIILVSIVNKMYLFLIHFRRPNILFESENNNHNRLFVYIL